MESPIYAQFKTNLDGYNETTQAVDVPFYLFLFYAFDNIFRGRLYDSSGLMVIY